MPTINGTDAAEALTGTTAADLINGFGGSDTLIGGGGPDTLNGGDGNDRLEGSNALTNSLNVLNGGAGDDLIISRSGTIDGGDGVDTLDLSNYTVPDGYRNASIVTSTGDVVSLQFNSRPILPGSIFVPNIDHGTARNIEIFRFGPGSDIIDLSTLGSVTIYGGAAGDTLRGGTQASKLFGEDGSDLLVGNFGNDTLDGGEGADSLVGAGGDDSLIGGEGADTLDGGAGNDTLQGGAGNDLLIGGGGTDSLYGGDGDDRIVYGAGYVDGGAGHDTLDIGAYNASAFFFSRPLTIRTGDTAGSLAIDAFLFERGGSGQTITETRADGIEQLILGTGVTVNLGNITRDISIVSAGAYGERIITGSGADKISLNNLTNQTISIGYTVDAGAGTDTLILKGSASDYLFQQSGSNWLVYDGRAAVSTITNVEQVQFGSGPAMSFQAAAAVDFDALAYAARYADVRTAFGADPLKAYQHYQSIGKAEGRSNAPFEPLTYIASSPDLIAAYGANAAAGTLHFQTFYALYPRPIDTFNGLTYVASNPDLFARFGGDELAATRHYIETGFAEGRPTATFDPLLYAASSPDLALAFGTNVDAAALHYITWSAQHTHPTSGFDGLLYLASNPSLIPSLGVNPAAAMRHYLEVGAKQGLPTQRFDALNYAAASPDLAAAFGTDKAAATLHYVTFSPQNTHPLNGFDAVAYLLTYGDLAGMTRTEAFDHWLTAGAKQGRIGDAAFGREQTRHGGDSLNPNRYVDQFESSTDRDWFSTGLLADRVVTFELTGAVGGLALYDARGNLLATDADGHDFRYSVSADTPRDATFYLVAIAGGQGNYTIAKTYGPLSQGAEAAGDDAAPFSLSTWENSDPTGMI